MKIDNKSNFIYNRFPKNYFAVRFIVTKVVASCFLYVFLVVLQGLLVGQNQNMIYAVEAGDFEPLSNKWLSILDNVTLKISANMEGIHIWQGKVLYNRKQPAGKWVNDIAPIANSPHSIGGYLRFLLIVLGIALILMVIFMKWRQWSTPKNKGEQPNE
jgi:hypothetical protein